MLAIVFDDRQAGIGHRGCVIKSVKRLEFREWLFRRKRKDRTGKVSETNVFDRDLHLRITNNMVGTLDATNGLEVDGIAVRTNAPSSHDIFLDIRGNNSNSLNGGAEIVLRQATVNNTFSIEDLRGSGTNAADVQAFLQSQNPLVVAGDAVVQTAFSVVDYTTMNLNNTNTPAPLTALLASPGDTGPDGRQLGWRDRIHAGRQFR